MSRRFGFTRVCAAMILALAMASAASAQTTLGRLAGTVLDQSGGVLPGATVTLTSVQTNQVQTTVTSETGAFLFPQVAVGTYKVEIVLEGFKTGTFTDVVINVGQEYSLTAKLELGALTETVTVEAGASLVKTTTPEVTATVQQRQVLDIPLANRDVTNLIKLQPGVQAIGNRAQTTINGGRPTWTQVTLDGINIQDNFIRTNSLDFLPNRPNSDNVAEFAITTSVSGAESAGGATSVRMITPSGTNRFTGSVFEFNRDNKFAANSFFNNAAVPKVEKSELSRHQFGGRIGGPIVRNKLFFFANYEAMRQKQQFARNLTIPKNADFFSGVFRYLGTDGVERTANVLGLTGLGLDSTMQAGVFSKIPVSSLVNNTEAGDGRNTAGYRFNQDDLNNRDQYTFRGDYELSSAHRFEGVYSYFKETDDRTDLDFISPRPLVYTNSDPKRLALAWRWTASANLQNEIRGGFNLAPVQFASDWDYDQYGALYNNQLGIVNPIGGWGSTAGFMPQGRYTDTYQLNENASLMIGNHQIQMGGSWQRNRVNPYNFAGRYPTVTFGFNTATPAGIALTNADLPGISAADLAIANNMAAMLSGTISSLTRTFQVRDTTSGYVPGIPSNEFYTLDNITSYVQDNWRWKPNFTVRAGLKWEYYSPLREDSNLGFLPVLGSQPFEQVMRDPNATVSFVDGDFYNKDLNNFGPTVGFNWDPTSDGKTAIRGGYSLTFVNEETVTTGRGASRGNAGLSTGRTLSQQYTTVSAGVPEIPVPAFLTERTLADQMALSNTGVLWGIDPELVSPHVHQVSIGIQREIGWSTAVEARYVGTFGRGIWRGVDYNQVRISDEFLADFNRARQNGYLAQAAGLPFSGAFNASVSGSQPLSLLPSLGLSLANSTVVNNLQTNQVGGLADTYVQNVPGTRSTFLQNPGIYSSNALFNGAFSDYHSLQFEARRRFKSGFFGQLNYTWSDTKTDSSGTAQNRFEAFMDNNRPELSTGRSVFHNTHVVSANAIYELPFGSGRRFLNQPGILNQIVGGWQLGTIVSWQSGSPLSIFSGRGTFNRGGRSNVCPTGCNTAFTNLSADQIKGLLGVYNVGNKIYWIDPKVIGPDGRGVGTDNLGNAATFDGQVFFNPGAGEVGNLPVMAFDSPAQFRIDLALSKRFRFLDRYGIEFKGEAFNLTNTPSWWQTDMNINSTDFGRITDVNVGSRVIQLSARFDF
jgi:Carboxypeptidase regulatory-like domain